MKEEGLDWRIPRVRLNLGATEVQYAVDTSTQGGGTTPVTPYKPPQPVVTLPIITIPSWYAIQTPPPTALANEDIYIKPNVNVKYIPTPSTSYPSYVPEQKTATQKYVESLPSLTPAENAAWIEPQRVSIQAQLARQQSHPERASESAIGQYMSFVQQLNVAYAETPKQKYNALRAAWIKYFGNVGLADKAMKASIYDAAAWRGVSPSRQTETVYAIARGNIIGAGKEVVSDVVSEQTRGTKSAFQDISDSFSSWLKGSTNVAKSSKDTASSVATTAEGAITEWLKPVVAAYAGKASVLGFSAKFDKYINAKIPEDASRAREWSTKVYTDIIRQSFQSTPKDPLAKQISDEIKQRWTDQIRANLAESTRTDADANPSEVVAAAKRLQQDLAGMKKDIADTTERHVAASIGAAAPERQWAVPHTETPAVNEPGKFETPQPKQKRKRYGPESYDLPE